MSDIVKVLGGLGGCGAVKRFTLLRVGIALTIIVSVLSFTPLHWEIQKAIWGVPEEYYPELLWIFFGLPVALLVLIAGVIWAVVGKRKPPPSN